MNGYAIQILVIFLLLFFSAFFSATETAFSSLNRTKLHSLAESGIKKAGKTLKLCDKYDNLLTTILIGNNIVNIAMSSIGTVMFVALLGNSGATVSTIVLTLLVLILGEITPKCIAKRFPERFAIAVTPAITFFIYILRPLSFVFSGIASLVARIVKGGGSERKLSQEELLLLVEEVENEGTLDTEESQLVRNAIEFSDVRAVDVLTHRTNVVGVDVNSGRNEVRETFEKTRFSRLPVYENSIDNIVGILNLRQFFVNRGADIRDIIEKPLFVLGTEKIDNILHTLQKEKTGMAVVLDEYGGTLGILTVEDIVEKLVGEIWDEHDEISTEIKKNPDGTYTVDGSTPLDSLSEKLDTDFDTESVTVGGFVTEQFGRIPEPGNVIEYNNLVFLVTEADLKKIETVNISVKEDLQNENIDAN
ncbi:MAG: HlyC/CorC family transporter [Clostridia bacterium]|nr:HlyC/CorC family transporter [Clostridia bacterium]